MAMMRIGDAGACRFVVCAQALLPCIVSDTKQNTNTTALPPQVFEPMEGIARPSLAVLPTVGGNASECDPRQDIHQCPANHGSLATLPPFLLRWPLVFT